MQRIDDRTVELTGEEQLMQLIFDMLLDRGYSIEDAVRELRENLGAQCPVVQVSEEFLAWLSR